MATINRFNKFLPRDYSMKFYMPEFFTPNFEQWDSVLAGQQQKYNAAVAATQKYPKHLEWRGELAGQYKKNIESKLDDVTTSYINEGVRTGNRKMRDMAFELNQQWNPGGLAHELEKEFEEYQSGIKQITDYYEKNKAENSANRTYSLTKLRQSAQGEFKYNPDTGLYNRASIVPELVPYVDIAEEAMKVVKEIKDSGTSTIIKRDRAWFEKIEREGVTEDTIKQVTDELLKQPKYAQQLGVEKWKMDQNFSEEDKTNLVEKERSKYATQNDKMITAVNESAKSKDINDRKKLQSELQKYGYYTGKIDGNIGKETQAAMDNYLKDLDEQTEKKMNAVSYDNLVMNSIKDSYAKPLIKAFAREKVKRDLIFNKEWETNMKIQAQKKNTSDIVTAIQSLKEPTTTDYLATPGLSTPMETMNKIRSQNQEMYSNAKKSFDQISQFSGITDVLGTRAANEIHKVTQTKMQSKSYDEFVKRMGGIGYTDKNVIENAWNFYNSPAAGDLYNSYTSMQAAKESVDSIDNARESMITDYIKTPEGKKEAANIRKKYGFKGTDEEFVKSLVSGNQKFVYETGNAGSFGLGGVGGSIKYSTDEGKSFLNKMDNYYKDKPEAMPQSLRGYRLNAIKGEGAELAKVMVKDIVDGYTNGYSSNGQAGIVFSHIGKNNQIDPTDVKLDDTNFSFNVDASGITYYLTGKDSNGKPVSSVVNAPKEHYGRLARMALSLKKQAKETGDSGLDAIANQVYAVTTEGPRYQNAVEDHLILTDDNTFPLDNVADPMRSTGNQVETFKNNANVKGLPIGSEEIVNGLVYQKFKTYNPKTKSTAYMMTVQTEEGFYVPIKNSDGGLYYKSSMEAESPIWDRKMMSQIPVEINQQKIKQSNVTPEQGQALMLGVQGMLDMN